MELTRWGWGMGLGGLVLAGLVAGCGEGRRVVGVEGGAGGVGGASGEWFENITERSGLGFVHVTGTDYFMPDQVASGVVVFDYDRDGRLDLYFVQAAGTNSALANALYHQEADGRFRDVSAGSGADLRGHGTGAIAGDLNNDGLPELVVTEYGGTRVLWNQGQGRFVELARSAGVDNPRWAAPASLLDYDRDGWLDLVVGNYVDYDPTQECHDVQGRRDFCAPAAYAPTVTRLWRNVTGEAGGSPRFEEVTEGSGLSKVPGVALGLVCADLDGDGWVDIFCADDGRPNRLFVNRRDGTFVEEAVARGLALNAMGRTAANMGVAYVDVDHDGLGDLFVTHLSDEFHSLFRQDRRGLFVDVVARAGLMEQGWRGTGFGAVMADFDADGATDLAMVNGLVRRLVPGQTPVMAGVSGWWAVYAQRPQLFAGEGGGKFREVTAVNPAFCGKAMVGRSLALGDLDGDGAPDLVVGNTAGPAQIYRNIAPRRGHWLTLELTDPALGGREAIGAEAVVVGEGGVVRWWAVLQPATSYLVSHEPRLHFGLGSVSQVKGIEVSWPDGVKEWFAGGGVDRVLSLRKGEGRRME